jgi:hypothetical protein
LRLLFCFLDGFFNCLAAGGFFDFCVFFHGKTENNLWDCLPNGFFLQNFSKKTRFVERAGETSNTYVGEAQAYCMKYFKIFSESESNGRIEGRVINLERDSCKKRRECLASAL